MLVSPERHLWITRRHGAHRHGQWARLKSLVVALSLAFILAALAAAPALAWPPPQLEQVTFTNSLPVVIDHQHNDPKEPAISKNEFEGEADWKKDTETNQLKKNWPIAYVQKETMALEARFTVTAETREFIEQKMDGDVTITGNTTVAGTQIAFTKTFGVEEIDAQLEVHEGYLSTGEIAASNVLPAGVRYQHMTIGWKWRVQVTRRDGEQHELEQGLGKSTHNLYVTFKPTEEAIYFTLLDLDTEGAEQQTPTEASTLEGVWKGFASKSKSIPTVHVRTYNPATGKFKRNGAVLRYYSELEPGSTLEELLGVNRGAECLTTAGLLKTFEGRCGAWAFAFHDALGIEGVGSKLVHLLVKFGNEGAPCFIEDVCVMLVKNWNFVGEGTSGDETFPYRLNEVIDQNGVPGQGVANPVPWFWDHEIVKAGTGASAALYDPSYGAGPFRGGIAHTEESVLDEYQAMSIDGFCRPNEAEKGKAVAEPFACQKAPATVELTPEEELLFP